MAQGYGFWWRDVYWGSLSTGGRPDDGRHDFFFGPVGADTHGHTWIQVAVEGAAAMGTQLKDRGEHVVTRVASGPFSTQAVLRGRVQYDGQRKAVTIVIANLNPPSTYSAAPVTSSRPDSRRAPKRVDIGVPEQAKWFEFELAFTKNRAPSTSSNKYMLPFSEPSPLAASLSILRWGE